MQGRFFLYLNIFYIHYIHFYMLYVENLMWCVVICLTSPICSSFAHSAQKIILFLCFWRAKPKNFSLFALCAQRAKKSFCFGSRNSKKYLNELVSLSRHITHHTLFPETDIVFFSLSMFQRRIVFFYVLYFRIKMLGFFSQYYLCLLKSDYLCEKYK